MDHITIKLNIKTINHKDQSCLSVVDLKSVLPFDIKRCFYIYDIKKELNGDTLT